MALFKDMLKSDQTLFKNAVPLDYDYLPKAIPFRESEQGRIAVAMKPLFQDRNGSNVLIVGKPGIGKTAAVRHVLQELEEETEEIVPIYLNCWKKNSSYKVILEICTQLDYRFTHNKKTDELFEVVKKLLTKRPAVFVFDEIDKAEDYDFLYMLLEEIYKKAVILITNEKDWAVMLDHRIKSRLLAETLEFRPYTKEETTAILKERIGYAFYEGVVDGTVLAKVADIAYRFRDIRTGLFLLRESGNMAENASRKRILAEDVDAAEKKLDDFSKNRTEELEPDEQLVLSVVKEKSGEKIGQLYSRYQEKGGKGTYKTFQRRIAKLSDNGYISVKKTLGGSEGNTTIVEYSSLKKLTDFS